MRVAEAAYRFNRRFHLAKAASAVAHDGALCALCGTVLVVGRKISSLRVGGNQVCAYGDLLSAQVFSTNKNIARTKMCRGKLLFFLIQV
ncbi:MAG: hypothetical protein LBQ20_05275 [Rhodanobacter sp.]|jgi:hypothetical protein|nr:hypothetical protein [Rhodanobacter sp.]